MKIIGLALLSLLIITSCKKEEGCTDVSAYNFNEEADIDDESCRWESNIIFTWDAKTKQYLNDSISENYISVYIKSKYIGDILINKTIPTEVNCESEGLIDFTYDLGTNTVETMSYTVTTKNDSLIWTDVFELTNTSCKIIELSI